MTNVYLKLATNPIGKIANQTDPVEPQRINCLFATGFIEKEMEKQEKFVRDWDSIG